MDTQEIIRTEDSFQLPTYNKLPIALASGNGRYVTDTDGKTYLDFYGGHCVTLLGHSPEAVVSAIKAQADELIFYSNVVYSPVRAEAARVAASLAPNGLQHVYFCNSGTEANETALKLARTYTGKHDVVAMVAGFHGRTLGSLAATGIDKYRIPYAGIIPTTHFVDFGDLDALKALLESNEDIAAVILEPIQSMAGIVEAPIAYYVQLRALCDAHNVALIFDEVQTGVGRTGTFSISEQYGIKPDLITMAKSLASGLPVGATFASDEIAGTVKPGDQGTTFGGGMIPMAAMTATLNTIATQNLMARSHEIFDAISTGLAGCAKEVRGRGCLIGVVMDEPVAPTTKALRARGVLVGGSMDPHVMRVMPPVNATDEDVATFLEAMLAVAGSPNLT
ncbi:MAG: aminotransferase class III-fold pyridoxal phosphate-dependent enzyme [Bacteroidota bacterium]